MITHLIVFVAGIVISPILWLGILIASSPDDKPKSKADWKELQ